MRGCALTGHRKLGRDFDGERLERTLVALIEDGYDTFYCGMAVGFDLYACRILLRLKGEYALHVVACVPYVGQSERFSERDKRAYDYLLTACDERVILSKFYTKDCLLERNRYMVDRADCVVAYCNTMKSGTGYTVSYAKKTGKSVFFV